MRPIAIVVMMRLAFPLAAKADLVRRPAEFCNTIGMRFVLLAADAKAGVPSPIYVARTEVTQGQWAAVMGFNPSPWKFPEGPITNVTFEQCREFCRRLTQREQKAGRLPPGAAYRLPTSAEWEYACRAGSRGLYCFGDDASRLGEYAWYKSNSDDRPHRVAAKRPNAWGLFDMHGNAGEWCLDFYHHAKGEFRIRGPGPYRVVRGGGFLDDARACRCADAVGFPSGRAYPSLGFRVVLTLPKAVQKRKQK